KPLILSTGMSTLEQIDHAVRILPMDNLILTHSTSTYPCPTEQLNLKMIL
ncbi:MAG TPA: N-acetylneuraminate synthase, partial [Phycisphaerales bacterium]|nr:N-acetylneuraminate synthase [Phycisphaerales bacterium]